MDHPVCGFASVNEGIERPCGGPHDVRSGLVIIGIDKSLVRAGDERTHQSFGDVVAGVVVVAGEILLQNVAHDVVDARYHLVFRDGESECRVQDGEIRVAEIVVQFQLLGVVGDD